MNSIVTGLSVFLFIGKPQLTRRPRDDTLNLCLRLIVDTYSSGQSQGQMRPVNLLEPSGLMRSGPLAARFLSERLPAE